MQAIFWISALLLVHTYVGYAAMLWIWARLRPRAVHTAPVVPMVSVLVIACNEGQRIRARLENILAQDYPRERLQVVLASDGSMDGTVEQARHLGESRVTVIACRQRRGKSAVLNELVPGLRGEIIVLADARQWYEPGAVRALVANFADPEVGAVGGELVLGGVAGGTPVGRGVGWYWKYEKFIRRHESRLDSTAGVSGAIYAIRRDLFDPIPDDIILDDVLIPMRILRRGHRVVYEPAARAHDQVAQTAAGEFARKVRTIAGNFQLFVREPWLLNPLENRIWFQMVSHKCLRLLSPLALFAVFVTSFGLLENFFHRWAFAAQLAFYAAAAAGRLARDTANASPMLGIPYSFCLLNWAAVVGFQRFLTGSQRVTWERPPVTGS